LRSVGRITSLFLDSARALAKRPFPAGETIDQVAAIARVTVVPAIFITIPFTVVIQFFLGQLFQEIGALDLSGAGAGFAIVRELGPFCAVLVVAGAGSTAICADLGSRTIREEIDAMRVLGIDPVHRLVMPRLVACSVVSVGLFGVVAAVGLTSTFLFSTLVQGVSPGIFISYLTLLTNSLDFVVALVKSALFGLAAGLVGCYLGLNVRGGPKGVGQAVNQSVVVSLLILALINTFATAVYQQVAR